MTALSEFLFPAPARRTVGGIIGWWERRRPAYNMIVGASGVLSLGALHLIAALPPDPYGMRVPWQAVVVFGLLANACYLLGPTVEITLEKLWGREVLPVGPALYRMGLTFSVGLTLLPTLIAVIAWMYRILHALL